MNDAGVVDEDVEPAKRRSTRLWAVCHESGVGHVKVDAGGVEPAGDEVLLGLDSLLIEDAGEEDSGSFARQSQGVRGALAAGAAGDQRDPAGKPFELVRWSGVRTQAGAVEMSETAAGDQLSVRRWRAAVRTRSEMSSPTVARARMTAPTRVARSATAREVASPGGEGQSLSAFRSETLSASRVAPPAPQRWQPSSGGRRAPG